jgi:hypothetical protein
LAPAVPIAGGRAVWRVQQEVPDTLELVVPRWVDDYDWMPRSTDDDHPLGENGVEIAVKVLVRSDVNFFTYETAIGRYQIQEVERASRGHVRVSASGVLKKVSDAKFAAPPSPRADGTFVSEFRRLMVPGVPVYVDPALVDRACPLSLQWSEDRLAALRAIAEAWPARIRTDASGQVLLLPPLETDPDPILTLSEGERSPLNDYPVVVGTGRRLSRDGVFNAVTARGTATDDPMAPPVTGEATQDTGRFAVARYGEKRAFFASPLLTTGEQCDAAASTRLSNLLRPAQVIPVELAPDPRLELDDAVGIRAEQTEAGGWDVDAVGTIVGVDLPLTVEDGEMRIDVGVTREA